MIAVNVEVRRGQRLMIRHKLGAGVDLNVDLDPTVEVDGSEAVRTRLTPPSTSTQLPPSVETRGERSSTSNVDRGLNVVRRRQPQRLRSTIRSTSTISAPWTGLMTSHQTSGLAPVVAEL